MFHSKKGKQGYYHAEKIKRTIITLVMFAIPITIYVTALKITGTNRNLMTIVAILGILPAAKFAVGWIMIMMQKDASPEAVKITEEIAGGLVHGYELTVTAYEGRMPLDAVTVCGNEVVAFSSRGKREQAAFMEEHIRKILAGNQYHDVKVKIFFDLKKYEDRLRQLAADPEKYRAGIRFTPDETYPDLSREELIFHTIMAISI